SIADPGDPLPEVPERDDRGLERRDRGRSPASGARARRGRRQRAGDRRVPARALRRLRAVPTAADAEHLGALGRAVRGSRGRRARGLARARAPHRSAARRGSGHVTTFWVAAALLIVAALAFVLVPVLVQRSRTGRWAWPAVVAAVLTVPATVALYFQVSNFDPAVASRAAEGVRLVRQLAER